MKWFLNPVGTARVLLVIILAIFPFAYAQAQSGSTTVFLVVIENKNWIGTGGMFRNPHAPYLNGTLVPMAAVANNYFNPPGVHPSLPNYVWMEAGEDFGIHDDGLPSAHRLSTHAHLTELLLHAGIPWRAYAESISGADCPLEPEGPFDVDGSRLYQPRHLGPVYFDDVTNSGDANSAYCIEHVRPLSELPGDLRSQRIGRYNIVTPDMCHDGHDGCDGNEVAHIDEWLRSFLPILFNSEQYKSGHAVVFLTADEASNGDGPIPFLAMGKGVRHGYSNELRYTHSSLLRTLEEIFHLSPMLGNAAHARDLGDLFVVTPSSLGRDDVAAQHE